MSHDVVLYISEENNLRLVYRYDIVSGCANLKEQLLVLDQYDNKCAGLWFNTTDYETPFNSAVKALIAAKSDTEEYAHRLKKLFLVMLDSGYSSMEVVEKLSPFILKNPDLALHANSLLEKKINAIENNKHEFQFLYSQYKAETIEPEADFENFIDRLVALIKSLLSTSQAALFKDTFSPKSDQRLFSRLNRDNIIAHRNDSPENRSLFDNNFGLVVYSK